MDAIEGRFKKNGKDRPKKGPKARRIKPKRKRNRVGEMTEAAVAVAVEDSLKRKKSVGAGERGFDEGKRKVLLLLSALLCLELGQANLHSGPRGSWRPL